MRIWLINSHPRTWHESYRKQGADEIPHSFIPQQFENPLILKYRHTTAKEIWDDILSDRSVYLWLEQVQRTITGIGEQLKSYRNSIQIIVEPASSAVLSGGTPGKHGLQGIGAGFIPKILNKILDDD